MDMISNQELPTEFLEAIPVLKEIEQAGFEAYFVGGSVRDMFLGHPIHDVDIATSAYPEEIKQIFKRTVDVGIEHGTVLVLIGEEQYEVTTFRTESTYQDYRRPDKVTFVRSLEEDLKRRDFTMNALAMTADGELIDLFDGLKAIKQQQIIAVGKPNERFNEDALRMMRGLRFASQLDFSIEEATLSAITEHAHLLKEISVERICVEWVKLLLGKNPRWGVELFLTTECFNYCPGLINQQLELCRLQTKLTTVISSEELAWILLLDHLTVKNTKKWLKQWKLSNKMIQSVTDALNYLPIRRTKGDWTKDMLYEAGAETICLVEQVLTYLGEDGHESLYLEAYQKLPIHSLHELEISGKDLLENLDKSPGAWVGITLNHLANLVLHNQLTNNHNELLLYCQKELRDDV
ncbi:CCA tRNA nucleotidyltransferase [Vagococcus penaei]